MFTRKNFNFQSHKSVSKVTEHMTRCENTIRLQWGQNHSGDCLVINAHMTTITYPAFDDQMVLLTVNVHHSRMADSKYTIVRDHTQLFEMRSARSGYKMIERMIREFSHRASMDYAFRLHTPETWLVILEDDYSEEESA